MARTNNLTNFLTDVSSAIKQKTGDNTPIPASDFDTEILSIETGGNYQSKTLNVAQNGNYNLLPDTGYDAISDVSISVSVSPILQNKTITQNGSYTADQNYNGLGTVIVNVPSSQINNQDKNIIPTTNQQIVSADSGYTGLGNVTVQAVTNSIDANIIPGNIKKNVSILNVTGTYEGSGGPTEGIKQFSSIQEMNASTGNVDGDLAVVYGDSLSNWTLETEYNKLTFPNSVVLSEAVSGHIMSMIEAVDIQTYMFIGDANLTPDSFQFNAWIPSGESITVRYESSDGLTYTKTDGPNTIELEQNVHANDYDWNDVIGNFIKYGNKVFNGLFQYNTDHFDVAQSQLNLSNSNELLPCVTGYG